MDKLLELISTQPVSGPLFVLSLLVIAALYRENKNHEKASVAERAAWSMALQNINDKRLAENLESVTALDRNSAVLSATNEASQARTMAFEQTSRTVTLLGSEVTSAVAQAREQRDRIERGLEAIQRQIEARGRP